MQNSPKRQTLFTGQYPLPHFVLQTPPLQIPVEQPTPQAPQLLASPVKKVHLLPHRVDPFEHFSQAPL
jgi:hypothetical protein